MTLTINTILKQTLMSRVKKSKQVAIRAWKSRKIETSGEENRVLYLAKTQSTSNQSGKVVPGHVYLTTIEIISQGQEAIVSCGCDDFMYTWEVALAKYGSARVEYSNGNKPVERNPQMIPGVCGHVYAFILFLKSQAEL